MCLLSSSIVINVKFSRGYAYCTKEKIARKVISILNIYRTEWTLRKNVLGYVNGRWCLWYKVHFNQPRLTEKNVLLVPSLISFFFY